MYDLWTPTGTAYQGAAPVGYNKETGGAIFAHTITLQATDKFGKEHKMRVQVLADKDTSQAHIEDMAAQALETFLIECRVTDGKKKPTAAQRKDIGKQLKEFREYALKRRESTNNRIYYRGI